MRMKTVVLNNQKVINAWCMFDWANSVYSLVIISAIFPVFYNSATEAAFGGETINFFGYEIVNSVLYSYALSFSFLIVAAILPLLSGIADYGGLKKGFMKFFTMMGGISCIALYFFTGKNVELGIIASIVASVGFSGSLVFYNSYLPEITTEDKFDRVSARGFSFGYIGGVVLLVINLLMIEFYDSFGLSDSSSAARFSFLTVGLWWIGFSQITFYYLPKNIHGKKSAGHFLISGYREIVTVWKSMAHLPNLKRFLFSFFFYNMGVQTVMYLAVLFGTKELNLADSKLIISVLIIQLVAIMGSYLFAIVSEKKGNKFSLTFMIIVWVMICIAAYFTATEYHFYALAFFVGMVMGGIQSLSRATYSKLIPENTQDTASYFSFYDVTYNISIVLGTFAYGAIEQLTGSMRNSTLAIGVFFLIGIAILSKVNMPRSNQNLTV
jgi:UMF1 family MFS transporter